MRQRGVFVSLFILFMVFGDTSDMMSSTSLYAFLVYVIKRKIVNADFGRFVSDLKLTSIMYIPKITNGKVDLYDERGCYQRTIVQSNAVFADINMPQTLIVVTYTNGSVQLYTERGCYQRYIVNSDAVSARWAGSDIAVTDKQGRVKIYDERGCYRRSI